MDDLITSPSNPTIKEIRRLKRRRQRDATGLCFIEGIQPVLRALENGVPVEAIISCPELLRSEVARQAVSRAVQRGVRSIGVGTAAFNSLSGRDNPVGLAAVARPRLWDLNDLKISQGSVLVALFEPANPGNVGTVVRTVDSLGGSGVVLMGRSADPFDPSAINASVGTVFSVPIVRLDGPLEFMEYARDRGVFTVTTSARAPNDLREARFRYPIALVLGSEREGLPSEILDAGDMAVRIPMYGQSTSLNLAVAAGVVLYEVAKDLPRR